MKERRTLGNIVRAVGVAEAAELWRTVASVISCPTRVISDQITFTSFSPLSLTEFEGGELTGLSGYFNYVKRRSCLSICTFPLKGQRPQNPSSSCSVYEGERCKQPPTKQGDRED